MIWFFFAFLLLLLLTPLHSLHSFREYAYMAFFPGFLCVTVSLHKHKKKVHRLHLQTSQDTNNNRMNMMMMTTMMKTPVFSSAHLKEFNAQNMCDTSLPSMAYAKRSCRHQLTTYIRKTKWIWLFFFTHSFIWVCIKIVTHTWCSLSRFMCLWEDGFLFLFFIILHITSFRFPF